MFGYFLRRVDKRFQLEKSLGTLPLQREEAVERLNQLFAQVGGWAGRWAGRSAGHGRGRLFWRQRAAGLEVLRAEMLAWAWDSMG